MKKLAAFLLPFLFAFFGTLAVSKVAGCALFQGGPAQAIPNLEAMPQEEFDALGLRIDRTVRAAAALLVLEDGVQPSTLTKAADALVAVADDPLTMSGPFLLSDTLRLVGIADEKAMARVVLLEAVFGAWFAWGPRVEVLGPHARELLRTIGGALRAGSGAEGQ